MVDDETHLVVAGVSLPNSSLPYFPYFNFCSHYFRLPSFVTIGWIVEFNINRGDSPSPISTHYLGPRPFFNTRFSELLPIVVPSVPKWKGPFRVLSHILGS